MFTAGQIIQARYRLQRKISGRAGRQTWLAQDRQAPTAERRVVIKFLGFGGASQWQDLKLFEREVQVLQQLEHPRIPRFQAAFHIKTPEYWVGFVTAYIPGQSLQVSLEQGKAFTELEAKGIAVQVLKILKYLHGRQPPVWHRDLKPSNLILTPGDQIYLVDFGAVQDRPRPAGQSFTVVGSYGYTPMEQFGGQTVAASDLYALGATLVHLLTGIAPAELLQPDLQLQFCDRITLSPAFAKWLTRMTAPALANRFSSAQDALDELQGTPLLPSIPDLPFDPQRSRIQIHPNPQQLRVQVPPQFTLSPWPGLEIMLMTGLVVAVVAGLITVGSLLTLWGLRAVDFARISAGILLLLSGCGIGGWGGWIFKRSISGVQLIWTTQQLQAKWQWWGLTYWRRQWPLTMRSQLHLIPLSPTEAHLQLHLQNGAVAASHTLVKQITPAEAEWLRSEIQKWWRAS